MVAKCCYEYQVKMFFFLDTFFLSLNTSANFNIEMLLKDSQTSVLPMCWL